KSVHGSMGRLDGTSRVAPGGWARPWPDGPTRQPPRDPWVSPACMRDFRRLKPRPANPRSSTLSERIPGGIPGTTGTVGARLVRLLADHPWFEIAEVGASDRSAGGRLGDLLAGEAGPLPERVASLEVRSLSGSWSSPVILSALPSSVAREIEPALAGAGHLVVSNASTFRNDPDVPLVIPEVNAHHLALLERQRGTWPGAIVTNPNCVVTGLAMALAPLHERFGIVRAVATTFQAISGAGKPGPPAGDLVDNVLPLIAGEDEKVAY